MFWIVSVALGTPHAGSQVGLGMAESGALGRQVGSGTAGVAFLERFEALEHEAHKTQK